jgi:hypothetical protein
MRPTVGREEGSPAIPAAPGIAVCLGPSPSVRGRLVIHGAFRLPLELAERIGRPAQRAVVVVGQLGWRCGAATPFREMMLFEDDDALEHDTVVGYFNIDVFQLQGGPAVGLYHLFASMDGYLSNLIEFELTA